MTRLTVIGESMLDVDLDGTAQRLCPDTAVPIVDDPIEHARPGGAALAAYLAAHDGVDVTLVTPMADDGPSHRIAQRLPNGVEVVRLPYVGETPVKKRIRAGGHVVTRIDSGGRAARLDFVPADVRDSMLACDGVVVADYGRGLTLDPLVREMVSEVARAVPVVWDPHRRGGRPVDGALVCTPNEAELADLDGDGVGADRSLNGIARCARHWLETIGSSAVAVTVGDRGALLVDRSGSVRAFTTQAYTAGDACGAGDRFSSALSVAIAEGSDLPVAVQSAVRCASAYVHDGGAAGLHEAGERQHERAEHDSAESLVRRMRDDGGTIVATGGCFDLLHAGHVASLEAARRLGDCLIVCLNSDRSVRRLKGEGRPVVSADDRARVLQSLNCVDAVVVFDADTPVDLLRELRPHVWAKGGDYAVQDLPERDVLRGWGGDVFVLPYMEGRSTTRMVGSIRSSRQADSPNEMGERRVS